jgi:hypothetical protein
MINRDLKEVLKYLSTLLIGLTAILLIGWGFKWGFLLNNYFKYRSQTTDFDKAQALLIYFDQELVREVPSEEVSAYVSEIRDVAISQITWQTACPFTIKLVFTFRDGSAQFVLIGTDGCDQIQLQNGLQGKFPYNGKLDNLEKEYMAMQTMAAGND